MCGGILGEQVLSENTFYDLWQFNIFFFVSFLNQETGVDLRASED